MNERITLIKPKNEADIQMNYNQLLQLKNKKHDVSVIEKSLGSGTIHLLKKIYSSAITFVAYEESDLKYSNDTNQDTVIVEVLKDSELEDEDLVKKLKQLGFSEIVIVRTILEDEEEEE